MQNTSQNPKSFSSNDIGCSALLILLITIVLTCYIGWEDHPIICTLISIIAAFLFIGIWTYPSDSSSDAKDSSASQEPSPLLNPNPRPVPLSHKRSICDIGPAEFDLVQSEGRRLYDFLEHTFQRSDVRKWLDRVMNLLNKDRTPCNFERKKEMTIFADIKRAYNGLGHDYPSDDPESMGLTFFVTYYLDEKHTIWEYQERAILRELQDDLSELLNDADRINDASSCGKDVFYLEYILGLCNKDLVTQYITLLYRFISATAKADGTVSPKEAEWLTTIAQKNLAIDTSDLEGIQDAKATENDPLAPKSVLMEEIKTAEEELDDLIGLQEVKEDVKRLSNFVRIQQEREKRGMKTTSVSYHCVFTGNPGTGKTTVARIVARIYKEMGILKKGQLIETDRSGLVAEYVGQTAVKTNKVVDSALDGVLFIDEAYSLVQGSKQDYGMEAIATLLKRMEDDRSRLVVILAGYEEEMHTFIEANPGLQSRFNRYIRFNDYSAEELFEIFQLSMKKLEYQLSPSAREKLQQVLAHAVANKDKNFGNARFARNLFERTLENQATRLATVASLTKESLSDITDEDIPQK